LKKLTLSALVLVALALTPLLTATQPAEAQLVLVNSRYRIVTVDRADQRVGVALPDADPDVRQSWVYIKPSTRISYRRYLENQLRKHFDFTGVPINIFFRKK